MKSYPRIPQLSKDQVPYEEMEGQTKRLSNKSSGNSLKKLLGSFSRKKDGNASVGKKSFTSDTGASERVTSFNSDRGVQSTELEKLGRKPSLSRGTTTCSQD